MAASFFSEWFEQSGPTDFTTARLRMVQEQLAAPGRDITDARVLEAMRIVPRHFFVPEALQSRAYGDHALPISANQTISNLLSSLA